MQLQLLKLLILKLILNLRQTVILRLKRLLRHFQSLETDCDAEIDSLTDADSEFEADCDSETDALSDADSELDTDCDSDTDSLVEADS